MPIGTNPRVLRLGWFVIAVMVLAGLIYIFTS